MAFPDRILAPDEDVVARLHPQAGVVAWAVVRLLAVIGGASFGMAIVPSGAHQVVVRLVVLATAVVLLLVGVLVPLLRWWTTLVVVTSHRLLHRSGVLARRGQDVALARISDVSFTQTLGQRLTRSGTLQVTADGERTLELQRVPGVERLQTLLHHMIAEDDERRNHPWADPPSVDAVPMPAARADRGPTRLTDLLR